MAAQHDPAWAKFVFGGISCMTAACVTNPIDVIKTRLQLQGELAGSKNIDNSIKRATGSGATAFRVNVAGDNHYKGFVRGSIQIVLDEGISGLYKGLTASVMREASYSTLRMGGYDLMKDYLGANDPKNTPLWKKLVAGATSGAMGAAIANPTDLVKVRMQAQADGKGNLRSSHKYKNTFDAFVSIYRNEGFSGLYKGVWPTTQRAALLTATQLASYDHIKHFILNVGLLKTDNVFTHFCASVAAGFLAAAVTSPVDVIKTRIMNQPVDNVGKGLLYRGTLDCFAKTLYSEGFYGLYKGFIPNWVRIGPHTIVTFIVYEQLRKLGGLRPI
jgi:hypothetical protein